MIINSLIVFLHILTIVVLLGFIGDLQYYSRTNRTPHGGTERFIVLLVLISLTIGYWIL